MIILSLTIILPGPALLEVEEAEAVDDADDGVVQPLLPPLRAEVRVLVSGYGHLC